MTAWRGGLAEDGVVAEGGADEGHGHLVLAPPGAVGEPRRRRVVLLLALHLSDRHGEVDGVDDVAAAVVAHGVEVALHGEHGHGRAPSRRATRR